MSFVQKIRVRIKEQINLRRPSLSVKITLWYVVLLLLTVSVLSALTYMGNEQALLKEKSQLLSSTMLQELNSFNDPRKGYNIDLADPNVFAGVPEGVNLQITSLSGEVINRLGYLELPVDQNCGPEIRAIRGEEMYYEARPIFVQGRIVGYLQGAVGLKDVELAEKVLLRQLFWLGGSAFLLAAIGGWFLAHQVLYPLEELNGAISKLTVRDLHRRLTLRGNGDELDQLRQSFNEMMERLEKSFEQQKRFVADASHELRTPLMVIGGHADILRRWGASDPDVVKDSAREITGEVGMMTRLVEDLLILARQDIGIELVRVNLSELLLESATKLPFLQEHQVDYDIRPQVMAKVDPVYIKQLVRILLENAAKYVPKGGKIVLTLKTENGKALLYVEDNGPGIPPMELQRVFDRFYRIDKARSRSVSGYGLGLSIAKRIVEQHQGRIWVENKEPHGALFGIELPVL